ncbi:MAG: four helix bundle protein [Defluviitaleaceae bacterium]|nr:four helix bundle protein [Defluviitaleaceae bacterium]
MSVQKNEMTVIVKAKDLCTYIVTTTQKSPKQFRFTFVSRLQNLAMGVIEDIYRANEIFIGTNKHSNAEKRLDLQHRALTTLKIIAYFSEMAVTHKCLLPKQYEQIAKLTTDCQRLLGAWINSDKKRLLP